MARSHPSHSGCQLICVRSPPSPLISWNSNKSIVSKSPISNSAFFQAADHALLWGLSDFEHTYMINVSATVLIQNLTIHIHKCAWTNFGLNVVYTHAVRALNAHRIFHTIL